MKFKVTLHGGENLELSFIYEAGERMSEALKGVQDEDYDELMEEFEGSLDTKVEELIQSLEKLGVKGSIGYDDYDVEAL